MKIVRLSLMLSLSALMSGSLFAQTYSGGQGISQGTPMSASELAALQATYKPYQFSKDQRAALNLLWQQLTTTYGQLSQGGTPGEKTILSVANKMKDYLNIDILNSIVPGLGDYVHQNFPGNTEQERFLNMQVDPYILNALSLVFDGVISYLIIYPTAAVMNWRQAEQYMKASGILMKNAK